MYSIFNIWMPAKNGVGYAIQYFRTKTHVMASAFLSRSWFSGNNTSHKLFLFSASY